MSFRLGKNGKTLIVEESATAEKCSIEQTKLNKVETLRYDGGSIIETIELPNLKTICLNVNAHSGNFSPMGCIKTSDKDSVKVVGKGTNNRAVEKMLNRKS